MRLLLLLAAISGFAASSENEVRAVLDRQAADWNRGDLEAFMRGYEESPDITFMGKTVTRGWRTVLDNYKRRYASREAMGALTFSELEIRLLGPDAALVLGKFQLERTSAGGGNASGQFTVIFRRTPQGWKIIHDHTS